MMVGLGWGSVGGLSCGIGVMWLVGRRALEVAEKYSQGGGEASGVGGGACGRAW